MICFLSPFAHPLSFSPVQTRSGKPRAVVSGLAAMQICSKAQRVPSARISGCAAPAAGCLWGGLSAGPDRCRGARFQPWCFAWCTQEQGWHWEGGDSVEVPWCPHSPARGQGHAVWMLRCNTERVFAQGLLSDGRRVLGICTGQKASSSQDCRAVGLGRNYMLAKLWDSSPLLLCFSFEGEYKNLPSIFSESWNLLSLIFFLNLQRMAWM